MLYFAEIRDDGKFLEPPITPVSLAKYPFRLNLQTGIFAVIALSRRDLDLKDLVFDRKPTLLEKPAEIFQDAKSRFEPFQNSSSSAGPGMLSREFLAGSSRLG